MASAKESALARLESKEEERDEMWQTENFYSLIKTFNKYDTWGFGVLGFWEKR